MTGLVLTFLFFLFSLQVSEVPGFSSSNPGVATGARVAQHTPIL